MNTIKYGIIYKATSPSGKVYIGQTTQSLRIRMYSHRSLSANTNSRSYNLKFARAIRKYGFDQMQWEILEKDIPIEKLDDLERFYISHYDSFRNGYNSDLGGIKNSRGFKHSEDSKKLMSESKKGKSVSAKTKSKISKTLRGRKLTEEHAHNIGLASSKRRHSDETKEKLRDIRLGKKHTDLSKRKVSIANKGRLTGESNPSSKLCAQEVIEIRHLYSEGLHTYKSIGNMYGVSMHCIYRIVKRKIWKHI